MKADDKKLRDILRRAIADANSRPRTFERKIKEMMVDLYNFPAGDTVDILNGNLPVETMGYDTLFKITNVLFRLNMESDEKFDDVGNLEVSKWFHAEEIDLYKQKLVVEDQVEDIIISNFIQVNSDQYICVVPIEQVVTWRDSNRIKYNEKTQRKMTVKESKGIIVKSVTLVKESLKQIFNLLEANEFISDALTLNVNPDFYDEPKIVRGKLVISKDSKVDIIDGFHRFLKLCDMKYKHPDWQFNCIFNIMVFNEEKAQRYILQEDKKNHLTDDQVTEIDQNNQGNYITRRLNENRDFHLYGTLTDKNFVNVSKIIDKLFNPDKSNRFEIFEMVRDNINTVIEKYKLFNTKIDAQSWFVYLCVLKYCIDNSMDYTSILDKLDLETLVNKINFKNEPSPKHIRIVKEAVEEVI